MGRLYELSKRCIGNGGLIDPECAQRNLPDRAFTVGRAPGVNTLTLGDRALSGQHFKIVPHEGGFAVVDLDSTNGTLVNGRRIKAHHLEASDTIQAGGVDFEFKVILRSLM